MTGSTVAREIVQEREMDEEVAAGAGMRDEGDEIGPAAKPSCIYEKGNRQNCPGVNGGYCRHPGRCPVIAR